MNLTRRQKNIVDQIIQSEADGAVLGHREGQRLLDRSLLNEEFELSEAGPDHLRIDNDVMKKAMQEPVEDTAQDEASNAITAFDKKLFKLLGDIVNKHGMFPDKVTRLGEDIEDAMPDDLMTAQMQCVEDITAALMDYATACGQMVVSLVSDDTDWNDNPSSLDHNEG